ncbi:MAG: iron(III) transport system substrate-binding protein [Cellvibrionaceae bacterium]
MEKAVSSFRKIFITSVTTLIVLTVFSASARDVEEVNVYSARKRELIDPLLKEFSGKTGIKVNLLTGKDDALIKRLQSEGKASPADLLITVDAGRLYRATEADLLQPVNDETLTSSVPENLREENYHWYGLSVRARPIFYVKDAVDPQQLSSYEALADDKWKGRICIRSSGNIYNQSLVGSLITANGIDATQKWADNLVRNFARPPAGGDTDQLRAAAAGVCDIAIANTYYYGRLAKSSKADDKNVVEKLAIFWPNQADRGVHINVSGIGLTKNARNKANAIELMKFLVSPKAQAWYAQVNSEYPVVRETSVDPVLNSWGPFKSDDLSLSVLGKNNTAAVKLMDRAGWK